MRPPIFARIFRKTLFKGEDVPFVMELPPYRVPTLKAAAHHMWEKSVQYLKKMGTVILGASVIVWSLTYFPLQGADETDQEHQENCLMGRIGHAIEPVMKPLGMDWRMSVSILASLPAKEIAVSTLSILYTGEEADEADESPLIAAMHADPSFTPLVGLVFMVFILLCFPCLATLAAIKGETGQWRWVWFSLFYTTALAWAVGFIVYRIGLLII